MTYSCSDFTDSVLDALKIVVPEDAYDDPSAQADLALAAIEQREKHMRVAELSAYATASLCKCQYLRAEHALREALQIIEALKEEGITRELHPSSAT